MSTERGLRSSVIERSCLKPAALARPTLKRGFLMSLPRIARRDDVRLLTSSPSGHVFDDEQIAAHEVLPTNLNLGRILVKKTFSRRG